MDDIGNDTHGPILLLGAHSRAARAIRAAMPGREFIGIVRSNPEKDERVVARYTDIPGDLALDRAVIVNCVGSPEGDAAALRHVNHDVPEAWAEAGRAGGASGMVQISSFSIFGPAGQVDGTTPLAPVTDYGRSKQAAEKTLTALSGPSFPVALLRVPILVGGGTDKLAQLVSLASRTGFVPAANRPAPRSMLPYEGLAIAVREAVGMRANGPLFAADPEPFTPELLQDVARGAGKTIRRLSIPAPAAAIISRLAPGIHASLLSPSLLSPDANMLSGKSLPVTLRDVIAAQLSR